MDSHFIVLFITVRKRSLLRLCFYTCLSFCPRGEGCLGSGPGGVSRPRPRACVCLSQYVLRHWGRRLLLRTVRILLECILVAIAFRLSEQCLTRSAPSSGAPWGSPWFCRRRDTGYSWTASWTNLQRDANGINSMVKMLSRCSTRGEL